MAELTKDVRQVYALITAAIPALSEQGLQYSLVSKNGITSLRSNQLYIETGDRLVVQAPNCYHADIEDILGEATYADGLTLVWGDKHSAWLSRFNRVIGVMSVATAGQLAVAVTAACGLGKRWRLMDEGGAVLDCRDCLVIGAESLAYVVADIRPSNVQDVGAGVYQYTIQSAKVALTAIKALHDAVGSYNRLKEWQTDELIKIGSYFLGGNELQDVIDEFVEMYNKSVPSEEAITSNEALGIIGKYCSGAEDLKARMADIIYAVYTDRQ